MYKEFAEIDYDKMGDEMKKAVDPKAIGKEVGKQVGNELQKNPAVQIGFDEKEMYAYMKKKEEMEDYANRRRGYKKG